MVSLVLLLVFLQYLDTAIKRTPFIGKELRTEFYIQVETYRLGLSSEHLVSAWGVLQSLSATLPLDSPIPVSR